MTDDEFSPEELARLARARTDVAPPPDLEPRTVASLRERGLVRPRRGRFTAISAAAAAVIAAIGVWALVSDQRGQPAPAGPRFMLLLYAGGDAPGSEAASRRSEYAAWARDLASRGIAISGEELTPESRAVGADGASAVILPRGFFIVSAADLEAAQQIASSCPHLRYGGRIVIQRIA
jgi:hypothetical protein